MREKCPKGWPTDWWWWLYGSGEREERIRPDRSGTKGKARCLFGSYWEMYVIVIIIRKNHQLVGSQVVSWVGWDDDYCREYWEAGTGATYYLYRAPPLLTSNMYDAPWSWPGGGTWLHITILQTPKASHQDSHVSHPYGMASSCASTRSTLCTEYTMMMPSSLSLIRLGSNGLGRCPTSPIHYAPALLLLLMYYL